MTTREIKALLGLGDAALADLAARGVLRKAGRNDWDPVSVRGYVEGLREEAAGRRGRGRLSLVDERAKLAKVQAERGRLELARAAGGLLDAEVVRREVFALLRTVRDRLLEVPARIAADVAAESDVVRAEKLIDAEIRAVETTLADSPVLPASRGDGSKS